MEKFENDKKNKCKPGRMFMNFSFYFQINIGKMSFQTMSKREQADDSHEISSISFFEKMIK